MQSLFPFMQDIYDIYKVNLMYILYIPSFCTYYFF
jgi:hypothetical protein